MEFDAIQRLVFKQYEEKGYLGYWRDVKNPYISDIAELGLIVTEVSEAMEKVRDADKGFALGKELADIVIRVMNFASRMGIDLESSILNKHAENLDRPRLHGRKAF